MAILDTNKQQKGRIEKIMQDKIRVLAEEHWKYIEKLLDVTLSTDTDYDIDKVIAMCRFHYLTAWEHGAKHYAELLKERE